MTNDDWEKTINNWQGQIIMTMDEKDKQTINNRQLTIDKGNEETMQHSRENNIASRAVSHL